MEKQNKNLLLTFIELATEQGILKDGITEHKKKIFNLMIRLKKIIQEKRKYLYNLKEPL